ncbi:MAG: hypothetical protein LCI02_01480 [Proteobacteria bacterium]|nr:hypothetical protein [Pseudomonadota bacterium]
MNAGRFALTAVALAAGCLASSPAWSLGLGRLTVQSALGESLRAEIDVTSLSPDEAASLVLRIASAETYRAAGVEYNAALSGAQVTLQRRPDGRSVLRVSSERPLVEPFVDVIVEATWASGRLVREYTLLLDPPARLAAPPAPPTPAAAAAVPAPTTGAAPAPAPAAMPAPAATAGRPAPAPRTARADAAGDELRVRSGDTLSRIAARNARPGVSLEQMLVSLFRGNPQAFVGDNMNRLKAGAVLTLPSAEDARKVGAAEARDVIQAQSADFAAYRQRLAGGVTTKADQSSSRQARGSVQARVDDRKAAAAASPDKLTLSQGAVKASAPEARLSREAEKKDSATRVAELSRNVDDLKKLQQGTTAPAPAAAPAPAVAPAPAAAPAPAPAPATAVVPAPVATPTPTPAPAAVEASAPAPAVAASMPTLMPAPAVTASASAAASRPAAAPPPPAEEPGFLASLLETPWAIPGAVVLVGLLAALGLYRARSAKKKGGETSFLESRLQPDSFFGASGGQRIDTREAAGATSSSAASSMSYSLSQLDAIGDVDPVAEADVYLAYGRDLQAEEILKEAMRANPQRMPIRTKLLEVYAKRRDIKGFELLASQVHSLTQGTGEDWEKVQEMGQQIDPDNPLYQPGGQPAPVPGPGGEPIEPLGAATQPHAARPTPPVFVPDSSLDSRPADLDLDLDLGHGDTPAAAEITRPLPPSADINFDGATVDFEPPPLDEASTQPAAMLATPPSAIDGGIDFDLDALSLDEPAPKTMPLPRADIGGEALDFGSFSLPNAEQTTIAMKRPEAAAAEPPPIDEDGDPLARKLELAEEFRQIGDVEGARDLLEEVIAKADGTLKNKAQVMLDGLA